MNGSINIKDRIAEIDWKVVTNEMDLRGFSSISKVLSDQQCAEFVQNYHVANIYRKTVVMERYRFGLGEYRYFNYPLPDLIQTVREEIYPKLAPIANLWMDNLNIEKQFPNNFSELQTLCRNNDQIFPTPLILKYGKGGFNTLHQDLYGEIFFPIQLVFFLNAPDEDFSGGEFVLTEQTPRAQSKAIVLKPRKGDLLIFTTNFRPVKGSKGYYRVNMKHGVSEIHEGNRHTLGIIFHDALS